MKVNEYKKHTREKIYIRRQEWSYSVPDIDEKIRLRKSFHHDNMDNAVGKHNSHKWVIILEMKFKIYGILK